MYSISSFWGRNSEKKLDDDHSRVAKISELRDALGPLNGRTLQYCNVGCLKRYLEARNWKLDKAKKMLEESIKWRATYKPEEIQWHEVAHVSESGLVSKANFHDRNGRTVLIMRPGMQKTKAGEENLRHLVYLTENAILNLPEDQEQMTWLIDFTGWTLNTNIPISVARDIIYVLQNHYPERLAQVIIYNPPRIFEAFWKAVRLFVDAKTCQKLKYAYPKGKDYEEVMSSSFDIEKLPIEFGGKVNLKYNHEELFKVMAQEDVKTAKFWGRVLASSPPKQIDPVQITT